ncbi:MAG: C4-dicarboxylate ABC transporter [endosymbiont of Galathealinum brachiosum]|uniref:C4-dicarboxylate ABC transporter n=1 Tax=endosymbiont of Galathealinum brachiosum TaxID=2200906 RepID=A0A370DCS1_9GAMM|nr:MAG: C4-dicarboxylate ABC transporter [endosymbiont of Galathealinum brachiosum]
MKKLNICLIILSLCSYTSLQAKTFKIATTAPDGSFWMKQMRAGAKEVKKITNGRVKFKFYPGGVMGSEDIALKKIRIRQLQGTAVSNGSLAGFYPDSQIYALPMLFNSFEEVDYVRKVIDKKIIEGLEKAGMISFGLSEGGFSYAMSTSPIKKIEDLNQQKIWTPTNNKQAELTLKAFGLTPIPLNIGDVLAGLQTHLIDTVAISPIAAIALQWHTQIKYITDVPLTYLYATLVIDKKAFSKISKDDQKTVRSIMNKIFKRIDERNRKDNVSAFSALVNQGIEILSPTSEDLNRWYKKGENARNTIKVKGILSKNAYNQITALLSEFRLAKETLGAAR